jgi:hypothetical protein
MLESSWFRKFSNDMRFRKVFLDNYPPVAGSLLIIKRHIRATTQPYYEASHALLLTFIGELTKSDNHASSQDFASDQ